MLSGDGKTAIALVLALASTTLVNLAYLREHQAVGALPALSLRRPVHSLRLLLGSARWLQGFAMEAAGFLLYVAALALAPLALVQSVSAGGVGILAFASARAARRRVSRREALGAGTAVAGLLLLSLSLIGGDYSDSPAPLVGGGLWLGVTLALATFIFLTRRWLGSAVGCGVSGGLFFACGDIAMKVATQGGVRFAFACVAIPSYVLGTSVLQIGYQAGGALTVAGIATLLTNAVPIAAGPLLFGETLPSGALGVLRVLAFATVVTGASLLARPHLAPADSSSGAAAAAGPSPRADRVRGVEPSPEG
jgi:drug/metabolite transporter (DMT)-like permease